jgi:hypothetical protein
VRHSGVLGWFESQRVARDNGLEVTGVVPLDGCARTRSRVSTRHWGVVGGFKCRSIPLLTWVLAESCMSAGPNLNRGVGRERSARGRGSRPWDTHSVAPVSRPLLVMMTECIRCLHHNQGR